MNGFNSLSALLAGTATVAAVVICQPAVAKSAREVAQIAIPTTVQVNNPVDSVASGSGVIIAKKGKTYTVLTANHVVASEAVEEYTIRTSKGKEYPTTSVQRLLKTEGDPDLAVVTFESEEEYPVAPISNSDQAIMGSGVYVSGYPLPTPKIPEREYTFFGGQVSGLRQRDDKGYTLVYDAITLRGMSGGPVFDVNGRVVGIHGEGDALNQVLNQETGRQQPGVKTGRNLGIPINTFVSLLPKVGMDRSVLKMDNSAPDNDKAEEPSENQVKNWFKEYGLGILRQFIPRIPGLPFR